MVGCCFLFFCFQGSVGQLVWAIRHEQVEILKVMIALVGLSVFLAGSALVVGNDRVRGRLLKMLPVLFLVMAVRQFAFGKESNFFAFAFASAIFAAGLFIFYRFYTNPDTLKTFFSDWPPNKSKRIQQL